VTWFAHVGHTTSERHLVILLYTIDPLHELIFV